ncbi:MAG TPA: Ni/Fe hydrogenase subunit alpha [Drouetiella sp.]|jgi:sulfhydrogenase subunit alpha
MSGRERTEIEIPEICRVEGHSAVTVDMENGKVVDVKLEVFEGFRFFERIVVGHQFDEMPHVTSRICAICSTGHVLASIRALEEICNYVPPAVEQQFRELMHLGMIIESHATHICALALPDFLHTPDLVEFATKHQSEFALWTRLRELGASIQTVVGGRPFHPVNLHVGGLSHYPSKAELQPLLTKLDRCADDAVNLCKLLEGFNLPEASNVTPCFLALVPDGESYGYFGKEVISSAGWREPISEYKKYLSERAVGYSHSKRTLVDSKPFMVGAMARLFFFSERLGATARALFEGSPLASKSANTLWNNFAQAIEIVEAIERAISIIHTLLNNGEETRKFSGVKPTIRAGQGVGAVECPRGTLYHSYKLDEKGVVLAADMITPSVQNSAHIELDIRTVAELECKTSAEQMRTTLETLVRAYDPCNTCATHMVKIRDQSLG